jgi:probable addiction module antidote protein
MPAKRVRPVIGPNSSREEMAAHISHALATSNIDRINRAIRAAMILHPATDIAKKSGVERTSLYRAFGPKQYPHFTTVLNVLDAMGLQLKVTVRALGAQSKLISKRIKPAIGPNSCPGEMAARISHALATSDIVRISLGIRDVILLHSIPDLAKSSGVKRQSLYRAFGGKHYPQFTTVLNVLDAMGLQLKVIASGDDMLSEHTKEPARRMKLQK